MFGEESGWRFEQIVAGLSEYTFARMESIGLVISTFMLLRNRYLDQHITHTAKILSSHLKGYTFQLYAAKGSLSRV